MSDAITIRRHKNRLRIGFHNILGIIAVLIMLFPVYWIINMSIQGSAGVMGTELIPSHISFDGYQNAFQDQLGNLRTSLIVSIGAVLFSIAVATPAAYALSMFKTRWIDVALFTILLSQMIPAISIANSLFVLYNKLGLLDSYFGLVLADSTQAIPFAILILRSFMLTIPPAIMEAARVDGAGLFRVFLSVVVPVSRNAIATAGIFSFLFSWSDFIFGLTLTTSDEVKPVTLGIYQYLGTEIIDWGAVMATAAISSVPAILLLLLAQRSIVTGVTGGSVK